ncbi:MULTISPECIES: FtsK/SpoIIIE domain-containing protein [Mycolicibacterium]|uniref:Cell division protein Ftsk/SpoIIIE n=1 Tax=Mycolicibacterium senegalense TaxID=1796 RepID=A0A378SWX6_9MYCO|nr:MULTISPECIES: FtsK/SpoIIIE domain-containing protein [Mycolicibacterium]MCV7333986.1 cell division protein FtsK [Mycolicibacterium senegalense]MDR7292376.1 S-DNA-T family DNA segregation ATPase FtsK/SpoIIIE [Mycolicibacterium senegalense]QZA23752.1 cell division protein FtsK [Mycolicibacterium senegalense]CDP88405.1 cell division protein FtsK [Mycolicibacterium farcinogenes]STZ52267.1 cell division protein Ftsk/SpoIIIE [Mycolicibacterium senegalense]
MNPDPYAQLDPDTPFRLDHVVSFLTILGLWAVIIVGVSAAILIYWRLHSPETFEERFATPARLLSWRLRAYITWHSLCRRCGLSASEQVTRRDKEGRQVTSTRWLHPKLLGTEVSQTTLRLTVRARMGQTVEDLERAVPAIRDAAGAHSARAAVVSPGTLRIELIKREQLSTVRHAAPPTAVATTRVTIGRREDGSDWILPLRGRHTLTVGCSGAGKGSVFWGIACGLGPAVAGGFVHLIGIDLKYGIELSIGAGLFTKIATTEADAVATLAGLEKLMDKRGNEMAGHTREHRPTKASPLVVLLIDELAGVTAYMSDATLRKEAAASLSRILTKGRALGIVVAAFLQDPRKEILPMRGLFTQTIALRLRSHEEVTMVLGDGMADKAPAHRIRPDRPGTGYVITEDGHTTKVRSDYWSDGQIRSTAGQYGRSRIAGGQSSG